MKQRQGYAVIYSALIGNRGGVDTKKLFFEVKNEYAEYLCFEKADAFVVALLPYAMSFGHCIEVLDCPISEQMYWYLQNQFLPVLARCDNYFKKIEIKAKTSNVRFNANAVGTGFSAGVDSFYTLLQNTNSNLAKYNITHVTFFNVGACGYGKNSGGEIANARYKHRIELFQDYIKSKGLKFIGLDSNIDEIYTMTFNWTASSRTMAAALALQKLFSVYFFSSGYRLDTFYIDHKNCAAMDPFNVQCFSTESLRFISTGVEASRIERVEYISNYPETYSLLNVCNHNDTNCRTCEKCIRTMSELYALNKLENYGKVFDVDYYKSHLAKNLGLLLAQAKIKSTEALFSAEIFEKMKDNHIHIPAMAYIYAVPRYIINNIVCLAAKNKYLTRWWHRKLNKERGIQYNDID